MSRELLLAAVAAGVSGWTWFSHRAEPPAEPEPLAFPLEVAGTDGGFRVVETEADTVLELVRGENITRIRVSEDGSAALTVGDGFEVVVTRDAARLEVQSVAGRVVQEATAEEVRLLLEAEGGDAFAMELAPGQPGRVEHRRDGVWTSTSLEAEVVALPKRRSMP